MKLRLLPILSALLAPMGLVSTAQAQLEPVRTYCGRDRAIPVKLNAKAGAVVELELLAPLAASVVEKARVEPAGDSGATAERVVDLAGVFPRLWKTETPGVLYAQLVLDGEKTGPALVLQPLQTPSYAARMDRAGEPMLTADKERARVFSGYRVYVDRDVVLETSLGAMTIRLRPDAAPNTCWHVRGLVEGGFYTDVLVHRVASLAGRKEPDIIQTGDPLGTGQGGCGEWIDFERGTIAHDFGVVSMARFSDPNSASSQFMIALNREGTAYLDTRYTSFGQVIGGAEVVRAIAAVPVGAENRPSEPPVIRSARLVDAAPYGTGPAPAKDPARKEGGR